MSSDSDIYTIDISFHTHSSPEIVSYDPYYPFNYIEAVQEDLNNSLDSFSSSFSFSSPTSELGNFSALDESSLKTDEYQMGADYTYYQNFHPHSCSGSETESACKLMQRSSYQCNNFHEKHHDFPFEAYHNTHMDSPNFQCHEFSSPENSFFTGQIRRACIAEDLQNMVTPGSQTDEANFKVGRYSSKERKEKISRYRAKRSQRKFNKIIKYACRKTLADNRTRIRGRFARNDEETNEIPNAVKNRTIS